MKKVFNTPPKPITAISVLNKSRSVPRHRPGQHSNFVVKVKGPIVKRTSSDKFLPRAKSIETNVLSNSPSKLALIPNANRSPGTI
jgi:hypothetical protein